MANYLDGKLPHINEGSSGSTSHLPAPAPTTVEPIVSTIDTRVKEGRPRKDKEPRKVKSICTTDSRWQYLKEQAHANWPVTESISDYINLLIDKDIAEYKRSIQEHSEKEMEE